MINKKLIFVFSAVALIVLTSSSLPAMAQTQTTKSAMKVATQTLKTTNQITRIKVQGDKAIDLRIVSLNSRITKINALKNLSSVQKSDFTSQFQGRITDLTSLKVKIDSDTDLVIIKADYKSIFNDNRIFAIFEPKMAIMIQADNIIARANILLAKSTDTSVQTKLNDAITQANAAIVKVSGLTPQNYPAKTILIDARKLIKLAQTDLSGIKSTTKK